MRNIVFLLPVLFSLSTLLVCGQGQDNSWRESYFAGNPLKIGNSVQFLFDDYIVEDKYGLKRVIGQVKKYYDNPLNFGEAKPWEQSIPSKYNYTSSGGVKLRHIIFDPEENLYKGWYSLTRWEPQYETGYLSFTLYVESRDGISWDKPELDFFPIDGRKTNIVLYKENGGFLLVEIVLDTLADDPFQRYIGLAKMVPPGETNSCIVLMFSPDGKEWRLAPDPVLFRGASDGNYSLVRDTERNRWLIFRRPPTRALVNKKDEFGFYALRNQKRRFSVSISKDFKNWTHPRNVVLMDELDDSKVTQAGNNMDIDNTSVIKYKDVFFGFMSLMDNLAFSINRQCHLIWSRDGLDWMRLPERLLFIENGQLGEWDAGSITNISIIPVADHLRIYYTGKNTPQSFYGLKGEKDIPRFEGTGLASMDKDRFIGLMAGPEGGYLLTRQFILEGNRIEINCQTHVQNPPPGLTSQIKAELLQMPFEHYPAQPYPGFSMEDCDPIIAEDDFQKIITWNGKSDLSSMKNKPVYIRFYIRNSTLYTFRVKNSNLY